LSRCCKMYPPTTKRLIEHRLLVQSAGVDRR
jgi:hypothetical protein